MKVNYLGETARVKEKQIIELTKLNGNFGY